MNVHAQRAPRDALRRRSYARAGAGSGCGSRAELWELGALISAPGAAAQIVHADVVWRPKPSLHTAFVALQPIDRALGSTRFLPNTHENGDLHSAHVATATLLH